MIRSRPSREAAALLPWLAAALLWFGVIAPMRADEGNRLSQQSRTRREKLKAERALRETTALRERLGRALSSACRASSDPAALRQRAVLATAGLSLSPFTLSVTGGTDGGALVEASGTRQAALELTRRLGDPARGGFLRSATLRDKGERWSVAAATGVLESFPAGVLQAPPLCVPPGPAPHPSPAPESRARTAPPRPGGPRASPSRPSETPSLTPVPDARPLPFTLVAFLISEGRSRVSLRVGDEVRVIAVGESVGEWTCVSIDRDDGVVFQSPSRGRVVLKAGPSERAR